MADSPTTLHIGTSGYSYQDWKGPFYGEACKNEDMLPSYAARFRTVELNFSYYRLPAAKQLAVLAQRATEARKDFLFSIKAHRTMTHEISTAWQEDTQRFVEAVQPLCEGGHLGAVLLQFPHSFHYTVENRRHLDRLLIALDALPCACEFRSQEWLGNSVYEGLRARNVALVAVDEPDLKGLLPPVVVPTSEIGYIRFHGRNRDNWWRGDNASRYDYLYNRDELREWVPRLKTFAESARQVFVYFNNHWEGQAPKNAEQFADLVVETEGDLFANA